MSLPALITPFPNILAANIPNNIGRNLPFCSFASIFLTVSLIPHVINSDSSRDLSNFIMSSISPFEIINAGIPDP